MEGGRGNSEVGAAQAGGETSTPQQRRRWRKRQKKGRSHPQAVNSPSPRISHPTASHVRDVTFSSLMEDITCSICLEELKVPVAIACGHTFCRSCITYHWATAHPQGYFCPECRVVCPRNQMVPDYRLGSLVSKIQQGVQEGHMGQDRLQTMDPDQPVKLASTDESGHLYLYKDIIDQCFLNPRYSDYPAYLLCVIGEKRKGKSFLMNYIMRALRSLEIGGEFTLGEEEEPLTGFEWESGTDSTTKGIWMWNRPFILTDEDQKIAVFVLDTEGSQDIGGNREACIKLSALSLFLGSRLIFNVSSSLKETELDYMEMYLHIGQEFQSENLRNLDLLVRDWHNSQCNDKQAQSYITREMEYIKKSNLYPLALWSLQDSETRCFLLPHPGKKITKKGKGRLKDMDEDFRESLGNYIHYVVNGVRETIWNDTCGTLLTCKQLPSMLEEFVAILEKQNYGFSSPMEMFYTIKNEKMKEEIEGEFREFLKNQSSMILPSTMRSEASKMCSSLLEAFRFLVHGNNVSSHNALLKELEKNLLEEQEKFCENYASSFKLKVAGVGLTAAGLGMYGIVGAAARAGASIAIQPAVAVGQRAVASEVMTGAVALLKTGATAMLSRFLR